MLKPRKYIDKKTKAKIRIYYLNIPESFYKVMLEKAKIKKLSVYENNKHYIEFLGIKSKYYKIISIKKIESIDNFATQLIFTFEKLTNNKSLNKF